MTEKETWNILKRKIIESEYKRFDSREKQLDWIIDRIQMSVGYTYNDIKDVYDRIPEIRNKQIEKLKNEITEGLNVDRMETILDYLNDLQIRMKERII